MWDFYQYMMDNNFIDGEENIDYHFAWSPERSALKFLPKEEKKKVLKSLESLMGKFKNNETLHRIESIINFTKEEPYDGFYKYNAYNDSYLQNLRIILCINRF